MIAVRLEDGALRHTALHRHARGQLLGAQHGLLTVYAGDQQWVVASRQAVWIPPNHPHGLYSHGPYAGYSAYLSPAACAGLPAAPCVLHASALLLAAVRAVVLWRQVGWVTLALAGGAVLIVAALIMWLSAQPPGRFLGY
ncbi:AraC family ligand binding domain-containing protein, partial [Achromobacter insolitus]|uniref:AraC family ligand binding domain-containing protein n=1 Tax=Achromobacter insolitus TaxID=217204 RepID=UPI002FDD392F